MRIVMFYHSVLSDWNHGNAHFLRGGVTELLERGHDVSIYEPADAWSVENLVAEQGAGAIDRFFGAYPSIATAGVSHRYGRDLDLDRALDGADLVIVHEWNDHDLVERIGEKRRAGGRFRLLFHDTHHRAVSRREEMARYHLEHYDGILAFGEVIRELYLSEGWGRRAWTWHEAADTRLFHPHPDIPRSGDVVWIGNWGDDERTAELRSFLIEPVAELGLDALVHGVRYPEEGRRHLREAGIEYGGWVANFDVPRIFAAHRATLHIPRRPYVEALPGIPTIRPFEALACGIPLVSAPWNDAEGLFRTGVDYLVAADGDEMRRQLRRVLYDPALANELARNGLDTIRARHTCRHRVDELLTISGELGIDEAPAHRSAAAPLEEVVVGNHNQGGSTR